MVWRAEPRKSLFDAVMVFVLVTVLAAGIMVNFDLLNREARETALRMGLGNIRMSIRLYYALNERYPTDVKELLTTGYLVPTRQGTIFRDRYLEGQTLDGEGYPVDAFGHRYRYDPTRGRVTSSTEGYEQW